jgi:SAM-dependent methyltransferase
MGRFWDVRVVSGAALVCLVSAVAAALVTDAAALAACGVTGLLSLALLGMELSGVGWGIILGILVRTCTKEVLLNLSHPQPTLFGELVRRGMGEMNARQRALTLEMASLKPGESVCELGCADGRQLVKIAELVGPTGQAVGLDPSTDAVRRAYEHLSAQFGERHVVLDGATEHSGVPRCAVSTGGVGLGWRLGDAAARFDVIMHCNCIYFWSGDLVERLGELRSHLKKGGRHVFGTTLQEVLRRISAEDADHRFVHTEYEEFERCLNEAGFVDLRKIPFEGGMVWISSSPE